MARVSHLVTLPLTHEERDCLVIELNLQLRGVARMPVPLATALNALFVKLTGRSHPEFSKLFPLAEPVAPVPRLKSLPRRKPHAQRRHSDTDRTPA